MASEFDSAADAGGLFDKIKPAHAALGTGAIALVLYLTTINRTFGFMDEGELAGVAATLGIAHPTGYPTLTLLGSLVTVIAPVRDVLALNIFAALLTAAGVAVMTLVLCRVAELTRVVTASPRAARRSSGKTIVAEAPAGPFVLYAGLVALFTGLTTLWWRQAVAFEVYSFHLLLLPLVTLLYLRWVHDAAAMSVPAGFTKRGTWFALVLGLAFTNHLMMILPAPAFLYYYFRRAGFNAASFRRLLYLAPPFLLGLLPYLWLPVRAAMHPFFDWGMPSTFDRFMGHITGRVFRQHMFAGADAFSEQLGFFFSHLPGELAWAGGLLLVFGMVASWRRNREIAIWTLLLFVTCLFYAGSYDIIDIEPYFLTAIFAIGVWCLLGIVWLHERLGRTPALLIAAALAVANGALHHQNVDAKDNRLVEDMATNVLGTAPPNALIFSAEWGYWLSGAWYLQQVEGMRPDVDVIYEEVLPYTWYIDHLEHLYPEMMAAVRPQVEEYRTKIASFLSGAVSDPTPSRTAYIGMINAMIDWAMARRPVLVTGDLDPAIGERWVRTPNYLALRLMPNDAYLPQEFPSYRFSFWEGKLDSYAARTYELYGRSLLARAIYESEFGQRELSERYYRYALGFDPDFDLGDVPNLPRNAEDQIYGTQQFFMQMHASGPP